MLSVATPLPTGCSRAESAAEREPWPPAAGLPDELLAVASAPLHTDGSCSSESPLAGGLWLFLRRPTPFSEWRLDPSISGTISASVALMRALLDPTDGSSGSGVGNGGARDVS